MTTFFQSFLLWILAYITLFINEYDFSNRFMGAVTALLVLTALLSAIGDQLPTTAYFKFVDLWFNWFIANIFLIILTHVLIDYYNNKDESKKEPEDKKFKVSQISSTPTLFNKIKATTHENEIQRMGFKMNNFFKILVPSLTVLFLFVYFTLTLK